MSREERMKWIDPAGKLPLLKQCELSGIARSTVYAHQKEPQPIEEDLLLCRLIDEEYTCHPFYGSRRMVIHLKALGYQVNRKRIQRLMRILGLEGMSPGPNTSVKHPEHKIYPYLLRGLDILRPNHVWSTDITYVRLSKGFAYLVVILDWYSRRVLSWRISNSMEVTFCLDCLEEALSLHGNPEIFNTDQGSQFTSNAFTGVLLRENIAISMDGRGRALDNIFVERLWRSVKYEDIYLKGYNTMPELTLGLTNYFAYYNTERPHQSLGYRTPCSVYDTSTGGGAKIVDKWGSPISATTETTRESSPVKSEQHCSAANLETTA
jgi:putative transposase